MSHWDGGMPSMIKRHRVFGSRRWTAADRPRRTEGRCPAIPLLAVRTTPAPRSDFHGRHGWRPVAGATETATKLAWRLRIDAIGCRAPAPRDFATTVGRKADFELRSNRVSTIAHSPRGGIREEVRTRRPCPDTGGRTTDFGDAAEVVASASVQGTDGSLRAARRSPTLWWRANASGIGRSVSIV